MPSIDRGAADNSNPHQGHRSPGTKGEAAEGLYILSVQFLGRRRISGGLS